MTPKDKEREEARRRMMKYQRDRREVGERQHALNQPAATFIPTPSLCVPPTQLNRQTPRRDRADSQIVLPVYLDIFPP